MFQFSLRNLALGVFLVCVYAWFIATAIRDLVDPVLIVVFFVAGPVLGGLAGLLRDNGRAVLIGMAIGGMIPILLWLLLPEVRS
jgi:hypothetical protein